MPLASSPPSERGVVGCSVSVRSATRGVAGAGAVLISASSRSAPTSGAYDTLTPCCVRIPSTWMSASDRSWTIAPTLLWFGAVLAGALVYLDGDIHAIADRLTTKRETQRAPGPVVTAPVEVAEADESEVTPALPPPVAGSHD